MNIDNYLVDDSLKCLTFLKNNFNHLKSIKLNNYFYEFGNNFIEVYSKIENNLNLSESNYQIPIIKSDFPHFINFLSKNNLNLIDSSYNQEINLLSEKLSIQNKEKLDYFYRLAVHNYNPLHQFKELYHRFCPLNIQFFIEQKIKNLKIISNTYDGVNIQIKIHSDNFSLKTSFIVDLITRLLTINQISKIPRDRIICKIWLVDIKKKLPKFQFLSSHCVNSASTYCDNCTDIKIWRIEECKKVACHEIFHCIGLDFHNIPDFFLSKLKSVFNICYSNDLLIFESYVELWATLINCICLSYKLTNDLMYIDQLINYEIQFSIFQSSKILSLFDFDNFDDFFNIHGFQKKNKKYKQNTCAISYYIIKSALLYSINDFINFCYENNKLSIINFYESNKSYVKLLDLILSSLNNKDYKDLINQMLKINRLCKKNNFIYQQLRMTCLEFY